MPKPVKIMGAGPAGLAAAITLAQNNYQVVVYEKQKDCGVRFGGDLQGLENWSDQTDILTELRSYGLKINFDCDPYTQLNAVSAGGQMTAFKSAQPLFYLLKRGPQPGSLDYGLKEQALAAGIAIRFETAIEPQAADIVAAGPDSHAIYALDTGIIFETDMADAAFGMLDNNSSYLGYSYLLVSRGYGCMCTVLFDRFPEIHRQFAQVKETFKRLTGVAIRNPRPVGGFGSFAHRPRYIQGDQVYVGEAAGLQDLLWGFGIRYAIRSGHLAARCLMENRDYQTAAEAMFGAGLQAGVVNRWLWENMGAWGYRFFLKLGKRSRDPRQFLYKFFQFSQLRRLVFPLALWDLRRRHQPLTY